MLSACSDYFREMFKRTQCKHPVIVLKDMTAEDLKNLLSYMYDGQVNLPQEKLPGLIKGADNLKIKGLLFNEETSGGCSQNMHLPLAFSLTNTSDPGKKNLKRSADGRLKGGSGDQSSAGSSSPVQPGRKRVRQEQRRGRAETTQGPEAASPLPMEVQVRAS